MSAKPREAEARGDRSALDAGWTPVASSEPGLPQRSLALRASGWLLVALVVASWVFVVSEPSAHVGDLVSRETLDHGRDFLQQLAGVGEARPAYRDPGQWRQAAGLAYRTLAMSVLAIGFATISTLLTVMAGARPVVDEGRHWPRTLLFGLTRAAWIFSRAVPELVWALLIVFVFSPGILAGALALGLHNFGVLGRLCAEVVENLDRRPIRAVRWAGAGRGQTLLYAVLPSALPAFLTFVLYRWEVVIRTTIVVGFVSAAGLGREFRLALSFFHYSDVTLLVLVYVLLVFAVDA
ncbi:MAG: ABC transporter permease subunit, partial [Chloroflexota bacterium]|nr:ABC transporter permease subunit [Chloroflexota bacterium]